MNTRALTIIVTLLTITSLSACTTVNTNKKIESSTPAPTIIATPNVTPTASPSATPAPTKKPTPKITTTPLVDCTGPDGKVAKMTQASCDSFNKAWNKQTATPASATTTQATGCAAYNPTGALGTARVTVKLESGQSWNGRGVLSFTQKYPECKGNGLDYGWSDFIFSTLTRDFGGLRPGPYKVEVTYNNKNWSSDVNVNSGVNEVTVTVSNN